MKPDSQISIIYGAPDLYLKIGIPQIAGFILSDGSYALRIRDIQKALGFDAKSENRLPELLQSISRFVTVSPALHAALEHPVSLPYATIDGNATILSVIDADLALLLLETIVEARKDGYLNIGQLKTAKAAAQLLEIFRKKNIYRLIDEGSGFDFYKTKARMRIQELLNRKYNYSGFEWVKMLPDGYFNTIFAIYESNWKNAAENAENIVLVVNDTIFSRLENIDIKALASEKPKRQYKSTNIKNNLYAALEKHLNDLQQLAATAGNNRNIFAQLLNRTRPKNSSWPLKDSDFQRQQNNVALSGFNSILKKAASAGKNKP